MALIVACMSAMVRIKVCISDCSVEDDLGEPVTNVDDCDVLPEEALG